MRMVMMLCMVWLLAGGYAWSQTEQADQSKQQTEKQAKKARKAAQKAEEEALQQALFEAAKGALDQLDFVLEADRVEFKRGQFLYVTSNTNFVSLRDGQATVQLSLNGAVSGPNGLGGITVEGTATNIKTSADKKGNVNFSMTVQGIGISATVTIRLTKGTNQCTATVLPNFNSNRLSFTGYLYPSEQSNVFKGRAL
ncbi:MAG: DUF4251 domain-containing protein [Parabacteroides sp.]